MLIIQETLAPSSERRNTIQDLQRMRHLQFFMALGCNADENAAMNTLKTQKDLIKQCTFEVSKILLLAPQSTT